MLIGDDLEKIAFSPLILNNSPLDFTHEYRYLGVDFVAKKSLVFSARAALSSFHRASNSILCSRNKPNESVLMKLLFTNCVSILSYASSVKEFSCAELSSCNIAINNAIRRIFSYARMESVRHLRQQHNCPSINEIFASAKLKLLNTALSSSNDIIRHILKN